MENKFEVHFRKKKNFIIVSEEVAISLSQNINKKKFIFFNDEDGLFLIIKTHDISFVKKYIKPFQHNI